MEERFTYIPLTIDNILSFEDYIPRQIQYMIMREEVSGWGVLEGDLASGAALVEMVRDTDDFRAKDEKEDVLRILWIYVADEVRGEGIGRSLLAKCREVAEADTVTGLVCQYPAADFEAADQFFLSDGFTVTSDGRENIVDAFAKSEIAPEASMHTAWLRLRGNARTFDRTLLESDPNMGIIMPRLTAISEYLSELGYEELSVTANAQDGIALVVERDEGLCDLAVSILPDVNDVESYAILVQGSAYGRYEPDVIAKYLEKWQHEHPMTLGTLMEANNVVVFSATLAVDAGAPDAEQFKAFFAAVCEEIDAL